MTRPENGSAPVAGATRGAMQNHKVGGLREDSSAQLHVMHASADPLLDRLDGVQKAGSGWRARCPACGGQSRKLSIAVSDERVLAHCFAGCDAVAVLQAVGLQWADLQPPRNWPLSPDEKRRQRRVLREMGWAGALEVLRIESLVVRFAAMQVSFGGRLAQHDEERLALAIHRIEGAAHRLCERQSWKPDDCYPPARLAQIKREALAELRRQAERLEREVATAETAADVLKVAA